VAAGSCRAGPRPAGYLAAKLRFGLCMTGRTARAERAGAQDERAARFVDALSLPPQAQAEQRRPGGRSYVRPPCRRQALILMRTMTRCGRGWCLRLTQVNVASCNARDDDCAVQ
jgi:hypothetical protein